MFDFLARHRDGIRVLGAGDRARALEICALDPVASILAAVQADSLGLRSAYGNQMLGLEDQDRDIQSLCWTGANIVPVMVPARSIRPLADYLQRQGRRCSSLVGDTEQVMGLWEELQHSWGAAREVRAHQPSLATTNPPHVPPDPRVRPAHPREFDIVLPASVAMFTEEVGYDPTRTGRAYASRVKELIDAGRTFIRTEPVDPADPGGEQRVLFKADIGALALGVAQIQGVWVAPAQRGRGIGASGMAAVVDLVHKKFAPVVSLYVNDYNTAAVGLYRKVGFTRVGEYATVLF